MTVDIESAWPRFPDYRIDLEPCPYVVQVWAGEQLIAESPRATILRETDHVDRLYLPIDDLRWDLLSPTDHHSICPFKGSADYWSVTTGGAAFENVVWAYREPFDEVAGIRELVGVYHERLSVKVVDRWDDGSDVATSFPLWGDAAELVRLLDVEPGAPGRFTGPAHGPTARNVVEGGQLLGQAIVAASRSVDAQRVTAASMTFSRAASFDRPVDLHAEVLRGGRTFSSVEVRTEQDERLCSTGLVLLDAGAPDVVRDVADMPDVPGPSDAVPFVGFGMTGREIRVVDAAYTQEPDRVGPPEIHAWVRFARSPQDPALNLALLAQPTTHWTVAAALLPHPGLGEALAHVSLSTGVMQVNVAFHDDVDVTEWLLYSNRAIWAGRGLAQGEGRVFSEDGRLAASYSVQVMIRAFDRDPAAMGKDAGSAM